MDKLSCDHIKGYRGKWSDTLSERHREAAYIVYLLRENKADGGSSQSNRVKNLFILSEKSIFDKILQRKYLIMQ